MALDDARGFVSWVTQSGLVKDGYKLDLVIVSPAVGILPAPDWLRFGNIQGYTAAWLEEKEPGNLFISQGDLELHSSPKPVLLSAHELQESYDFVGTKNSVEEYRHKKTGQPTYVGRTGHANQEGTMQPFNMEQPQSDARELHSPKPRWWQFWKRSRPS